mmetsp:Transcript_7524/g.22503  ORF Transcript_7524/g.22503 Transcript_7524/m.22503 type:complete len:237 (+) Transcript_7524:51-761(+)
MQACPTMSRRFLSVSTGLLPPNSEVLRGLRQLPPCLQGVEPLGKLVHPTTRPLTASLNPARRCALVHVDDVDVQVQVQGRGGVRQVRHALAVRRRRLSGGRRGGQHRSAGGRRGQRILRRGATGLLEVLGGGRGGGAGVDGGSHRDAPGWRHGGVVLVALLVRELDVGVLRGARQVGVLGVGPVRQGVGTGTRLGALPDVLRHGLLRHHLPIHAVLQRDLGQERELLLRRRDLDGQ